MKKFKKELIALLVGIAFSYAWQLFAILMCYISDPNGDFITVGFFIPSISIQVVMTPIITWLLMGLLHVTWIKRWIRITGIISAFLFPFILLSGITVLIAPNLWREAIYWIVNVSISVFLAFTVFKPLLRCGTKSV